MPSVDSAMSTGLAARAGASELGHKLGAVACMIANHMKEVDV
jgi:hypothetical protein